MTKADEQERKLKEAKRRIELLEMQQRIAERRREKDAKRPSNNT